jgi:muramoyltetrapeptide carboxypeptidase
MQLDRRSFLAALPLATAFGRLSLVGSERGTPRTVRPGRLRPGDTIGLVHPASATFLEVDLDIVVESLEALGLKVRLGQHARAKYGYLAGTDEQRAADVNALFSDDSIRGLLAVRGGWGSGRILPHLDYDAIAQNPKILMGYSDITALHLAIHARTGLVTFHTPVGISPWTPFSVEHMKRVIFNGEAVTMRNLAEKGERLAQTEYRTRTITPGRARGRLVGGNLTVLTAILGSPYLPSWDGAILFLEDVREQIYRVDRMMTQLKLAGVLERASAVVFGHCTRCDPGEGYGSLTLEEVLRDHLEPLGVPAWHGAMIGHIDEQFTVPIGIEAEVDATDGTIRLLEPAVI